jgi:ferric-dicitrate binding protein FerR (iron transport regulator)
VLTSTDAAELSAGVVYFDSESRRAGAAFAITTEIGTVRDVGTQFLVRLDGGQSRLDVGVREGRVVLMTNAESGTADVGERLIAVEGAAAIRREPIATFGNEWEWAEALAPPFDTNGRSISDFLDWFAAQTGRTIEFADVAAERLAQERITGSIGVEEPAQKLSLVLATTDLKATLEDDGRVVISLR